MRLLLDTVVLSELRRKNRNPKVVTWLRTTRPSDLFLSVVTVGEVEKGICRQQRYNPAFAEQLAAWLETILQRYSDRILPVDVGVARRWGQLSEQVGHAGADLLIAATALEHGLTVVTRNVRHFEPTRVPLVDPFE
jgi:toxin FitB